MKAMKGQEID